MKVPPLSWTILAVFLVISLWHVLTTGIIVGSEVRQISRPYGEAFVHVCKYLHINGVRDLPVPQLVIETRAEAESAFCPPTPPKAFD